MSPITPYSHAVITLAATLAAAPLGLHIHAALAMAALWAGREIAQAEYRWIAAFGQGKRANMPWWGGFDPRVWSRDAFLVDLLLPAAAGAAVVAGVELGARLGWVLM